MYACILPHTCQYTRVYLDTLSIATHIGSMTRHDDPTGRLVKVVLPAGLVRAMDDLIAGSGGYANRNEFITDAVEGHLAELQAMVGTSDDHGIPVSSDPDLHRPKLEDRGSTSDPITAIPAVEEEGPVVAGEETQGDDPTWGMHNRDFPTFWALWHLSEATRSSGDAIDLDEWIERVVALAWRMSRTLSNNRFDTSGFPKNEQKPESSEGRFIRFFLGTDSGDGPLFTLGLAGLQDGRIAPTHSGLSLLKKLEGFSCKRGQTVVDTWTEAYLSHLVEHVPADAEFMAELLSRIAKGQASRTELLAAVGSAHPDWSSSVVDTNVAGFIARAREWGLVVPKQLQGEYVLEADALGMMERVGIQPRKEISI